MVAASNAVQCLCSNQSSLQAATVSPACLLEHLAARTACKTICFVLNFHLSVDVAILGVQELCLW